MEVRFKVPDLIWAQILQNAEDRGNTVSQLMSGAALSLVQKDAGRKIRAEARRQRVIDLVRAGMVDADIAAVTGELKQYVATNRQRAGLPANKRKAAA